MEYNDFLISTPEEFEKIAKEYSALLNSKNMLANLGKEILGLFNSLSFIYETILKNSRNLKLSSLVRQIYLPLNEQKENLCYAFSIEANSTYLTKPKNLSTLRLCLKNSIEKEAELVSKLINAFKELQLQDIEEIIGFHARSIKTLSQLI